MKRILSHSVSIADCRVDTFTVGGHGGAGKDTSNTGVRVTHEPSGAVGKSSESRKQSENKRTAFRRMANTEQFMRWTRIEASRRAGEKPIDVLVDEALDCKNLRIEHRNAEGRWEEWDGREDD